MLIVTHCDIHQYHCAVIPSCYNKHLYIAGYSTNKMVTSLCSQLHMNTSTYVYKEIAKLLIYATRTLGPTINPATRGPITEAGYIQPVLDY